MESPDDLKKRNYSIFPGLAPGRRPRPGRESGRILFGPWSPRRGPVEDLIERLKTRYTVVIVTHNTPQAARVSDDTAFMVPGEFVEFDVTEKIPADPRRKLTEAHIRGRSG